VMNLTDNGKGAPQKVWPDPPEPPRYRYVGELTGEENFRAEHGVSASKVVNTLKWLVGLDDDSKRVVLQRPQSGVVDEQGRIYVTDGSRQGVYVFDNVAEQLEVWDMARSGTNFKTPPFMPYSDWTKKVTL
jgi:hypothetical protein